MGMHYDRSKINNFTVIVSLIDLVTVPKPILHESYLSSRTQHLSGVPRQQNRHPTWTKRDKMIDLKQNLMWPRPPT